MNHKPQIHASFLKPYLSIIIFSLDEQRALRPLLNSVAKKFYEIRATNFDKLCKTNPICWKAQMNITKALTRGYENIRPRSRAENKPNQTQNKPNSMPHLNALTPNFQNQSTQKIGTVRRRIWGVAGFMRSWWGRVRLGSSGCYTALPLRITLPLLSLTLLRHGFFATRLR